MRPARKPHGSLKEESMKELANIFIGDFKTEWEALQKENPRVKYLGAAAMAIIITSVFL